MRLTGQASFGKRNIKKRSCTYISQTKQPRPSDTPKHIALLHYPLQVIFIKSKIILDLFKKSFSWGDYSGMFTEPSARKTHSSLKSFRNECYFLELLFSLRSIRVIHLLFHSLFSDDTRKSHQCKRSKWESRLKALIEMGARVLRAPGSRTHGTPANCNITNKAGGRTNGAERRQCATYKLFLWFLGAVARRRVLQN